MTASILKQAPNTWKVQSNAVYQDKTQHANFRGTKRHLNSEKRQKNDMRLSALKQQLNGEKQSKMRCGLALHVIFWSFYTI